MILFTILFDFKHFLLNQSLLNHQLFVFLTYSKTNYPVCLTFVDSSVDVGIKKERLELKYRDIFIAGANLNESMSSSYNKIVTY